MTNSPEARMLRSVSFSRPSRAPTEMAICGGDEVIIMKKLKGARLKLPVGPMVEVQPIGRGTTRLASNLYDNCASIAFGSNCIRHPPRRRHVLMWTRYDQYPATHASG